MLEIYNNREKREDKKMSEHFFYFLFISLISLISFIGDYIFLDVRLCRLFNLNFFCDIYNYR